MNCTLVQRAGFRYLPVRLGDEPDSWQVQLVDPEQIRFSQYDRNRAISVLGEGCLVVSGTREIGYRSVLADYGVAVPGTWAWEVQIISLGSGGCVRMGWARMGVGLGGPVGFDLFGYGLASGRVMHDGKEVCAADQPPKPLTQGDTLTAVLCIPEQQDQFDLIEADERLAGTAEARPLFKYGNQWYLEEKIPTPSHSTPLEGSWMRFYLNGQEIGGRIEKVRVGRYYPIVSLYHDAKVQGAFGPDLQYLPPGSSPLREALQFDPFR